MSHHSSSHVSEQHISGKVITITDNTVPQFSVVQTEIVFHYLLQVCSSACPLHNPSSSVIVGALSLIYGAIVDTTANLKTDMVVI